MGSKTDTYIVRRADQRAALTSPLRLEVLEHFLVAGPASVDEVAARMGRAPDSLYYHVRMLVKVGLLRPRGSRKSGKRAKSLYAVVARRIELPTRPGSAVATESTMKAMASAFRMAEREMRASLQGEPFKDQGRHRNFFAARVRSDLSRTALAEVNRHLTAIEDIFSREFKTAPIKGTSCSLTVALLPAPRANKGSDT
jgi:predicted transcriptional regulator